MIQNAQLLDWIDDIDTALVRYFADKDMSCNPLDRAMEYTLLAGGKRMRAALTLAACCECGGQVENAIPFSLACELLHSYSLIHDDLPAMDNDDMRRGKPANHVVFGEANAILAGDALQSEAFQILADTPHPTLPPERRIQIISEFAKAIGRRGMVAGQVMDLENQGKAYNLDKLTKLHNRKTGALLLFCVSLGGHLAAADESAMAALTTYGRDLGLLFQVVDDILDEEGNEAQMGKTTGKDKAAGKATFLGLMGRDEAHRYADQLLEEAQNALAQLPQDCPLLREILFFTRNRTY